MRSPDSISSSGPAFSRYKGCKVAVLGAAGFIGRWVARALCESGAQLTLIVRDRGTAAKVFGEYGISGDIVELDLQTVSGELSSLIARIRPGIIFNLTAYGVERHQRQPSTAYEINKELVETLCAAMAGVMDPAWTGQQLVHVGSALEYGEIGGDLAEDSTPRPTTLYGLSKLAGTQAVAGICPTNGVRGVTARLFTVYGPGEQSGRLLPSLMKAALENDSLPLTSGRQMRDFTYVEEVAEGLLRIGLAQCAPGTVLNLASGRLVSVREFARIAADLLAMSSEQLEFGALPTRTEEMAHEPVSNARLRRLLGWVPTLDVQAGVGRTLDFLGPEKSISNGGRSRLPVHKIRQTCRACDHDKLRRFLQLGPQPLANSFLKSSDEFALEARYSLDVCFCEKCSLVQLADVIDPALLFRNYIYTTGTSDTIAEHNRHYAATVVDFLDINKDDLIVEIASNDGSLLKCFQACGAKLLGVEPALNIAEMARAEGIETVTEFFNCDTARHLRQTHGEAAAVIANNVFAHVDDSRDFLRACKHILTREGLVIIEIPYLGDFLDHLEYDTVYHEHICYFSITALLRLCDEAGLSIVRIDHVAVHGGSIRVYAGAKEHYPSHASTVLNEAREEVAAGLTTFARYEKFARDVKLNKQAMGDLLNDLVARGKTIAGYGAPAKGNTLLNYCGISTHLLPYTVDKSPLKVGLYTPGAHIPVLPVETLLEKQPDYVLILAWNFTEEIMRQQREYKDRGGQFIVPLPQPKIIS